MKKRIGVLLSGRGSNFEALAESVEAGRIPDAEIAIVVSNREGAEGIEKARRRGIEARVIPSKGLEREAYDKLVVAALQEKKVDLVCLAGYMRLLSPHFVAAFPQRILNIHPSLLPAFPGWNRSGRRWSMARNFRGARCILWMKISTRGRSCCRLAWRLRMLIRRKLWRNEFCARNI